jgi:RNA polymerase-binding protein DksA
MSAAKKPSASRSTARKTATKKTTAKKTSTRKSAPKKTTAKSSGASRASRSRAKTTSATKTAKRASGAANKPAGKTTARKTAPKTAARKKTAATKTTDRKTATTGTASKKTTTSQEAARHEPSPAPRRRGKRPGLPPITLKKPTPKKASPARPAKFDKGDLEEIRKRLESERAELEERIAEIEANVFEKTQSDLTGEAGFDEDFADAGTATFDREREFSIQNNIRDLVGQINRAIARIDDGTYGTCERCGRPIDAPRLKALPHALLCMDCKRREERAR